MFYGYRIPVTVHFALHLTLFFSCCFSNVFHVWKGATHFCDYGRNYGGRRVREIMLKIS